MLLDAWDVGRPDLALVDEVAGKISAWHLDPPTGVKSLGPCVVGLKADSHPAHRALGQALESALLLGPHPETLTLPRPGLYALVNAAPDIPADAVIDLATGLLSGGARVLQLRAKDLAPAATLALGRRLLPLCAAARVPLIINDSVGVCADVAAQGVHLGQSDAPPSSARDTLGKSSLIGLSTHTRDQVKAAVKNRDVDWVALGPIFASPTKSGHAPPLGPAGLIEAAQACSKPLVAIGGIIDFARMAEVAAAGARWGACVSAREEAEDSRLMARLLNVAHALGRTREQR
jgi:thiamine-phosphate diphosphorylase